MIINTEGIQSDKGKYQILNYDITQTHFDNIIDSAVHNKPISARDTMRIYNTTHSFMKYGKITLIIEIAFILWQIYRLNNSLNKGEIINVLQEIIILIPALASLIISKEISIFYVDDKAYEFSVIFQYADVNFVCIFLLAAVPYIFHLILTEEKTKKFKTALDITLTLIMSLRFVPKIYYYLKHHLRNEKIFENEQNSSILKLISTNDELNVYIKMKDEFYNKKVSYESVFNNLIQSTIKNRYDDEIIQLAIDTNYIFSYEDRELLLEIAIIIYTMYTQDLNCLGKYLHIIHIIQILVIMSIILSFVTNPYYIDYKAYKFIKKCDELHISKMRFIASIIFCLLLVKDGYHIWLQKKIESIFLQLGIIISTGAMRSVPIIYYYFKHNLRNKWVFKRSNDCKILKMNFERTQRSKERHNEVIIYTNINNQKYERKMNRIEVPLNT